MSEQSSEGGAVSGQDQEGEGFKAITSQEDLNRIITDRVNRERGKYADYKDLKTKADQFDKAQEASKSELQKAQERIDALEKNLQTQTVASLRAQAAATHGITDKDDIELFLTGTDAETLAKQAKRLQERAGGSSGGRGRSRRADPGANPSSNGSDSDERQIVRSLFGQ